MERISWDCAHVEDGAPELGGRRHRFERIVLKIFSRISSTGFLRIELRRIGGRYKSVSVGNDKVAAAVVGRTVENQQDVLASKLARSTSRKTWKHAVFEVGMIR